jgi:hypothetical protein
MIDGQPAASAAPQASTNIRITQQPGGSLGCAVLFIIIGHQPTSHPRTAAGVAAACSTTFWRVMAFAGAMLIAVLFLPDATSPRRRADHQRTRRAGIHLTRVHQGHRDSLPGTKAVTGGGDTATAGAINQDMTRTGPRWQPYFVI